MKNSILWVAAAATLALGCSGSAKLSVSTQAVTSGAPAASAASLDLENGLVLDEVRMVVRKVELEGDDLCPAPAPTALLGEDDDCDTTEGACEDDDGEDGDDDGEDEDGDECEATYGPFAVVIAGDDLAAGTLSFEFDVSVAQGSYEELEFLVNTVPWTKTYADPVLEDMSSRHASVLVLGTIDGEPFEYATPVAFTQELEPFDVPEGGTNLTLTFSPDTWFVDSMGNRLDPRDDANRTEIDRNIRASLRAFEDDDEDGCDDDDGGDCDDDDDEDEDDEELDDSP